MGFSELLDRTLLALPGPTPRVVRPSATYDLRSSVLRPNQDIAACRYAGDDEPEARHLAVSTSAGDIVAIGTYHPQSRPDGPTPGGRIRGMATHPSFRARGCARAILRGLLIHACWLEVDEVWCNARTGAEALYERAGFETISDVFELPKIGPHVVMVWHPSPSRVSPASVA